MTPRCCALSRSSASGLADRRWSTMISRRRVGIVTVAVFVHAACGGSEQPRSPVAPAPILAPRPLTSCEPNMTGPSLAPLAPCCVQPNYVSEPDATLRRWERFPVRVSIDSQSLSLAGDAAPVYVEAIKEGLGVWSVATGGVIGTVEADLDLPASDIVLTLADPPDDDCYLLECLGQFVRTLGADRMMRGGTIELYPAILGNHPADYLRRIVAKLTGHEMGHALGLALHSVDDHDLMFHSVYTATQTSYPWVSQRDLNTVGTAYCR